MKFRNLSLPVVGILFFACTAFAQISAMEGNVKGADGKPIKGAVIKMERLDIKGHYTVKTNKKGHYIHAGLPLGTYNVICEVDGKDVDRVQNVRTRLGDPIEIDFDLQKVMQRQRSMQQAAQTGQLTEEQTRQMTPEQKAAFEKAMKEREKEMAKNKALNDAFNQGMDALKAKQWDAAVASLTKASELDPKQHVVWAQLAEALIGQASTKTGAEHDALVQKGLDSYQKALQIMPNDAAYHNNYALALAKAKKTAEAEAELSKAAELDAQNAGKYYYNLGAVLVNTGQTDAAGDAFKKAIAADPNYAPAQYQYGVYLISKAQITPDGKVVPVPGTQEAFEKYLQLDPNGPNAESARSMLQSMSASVNTTYQKQSTKKGKK